MKFAKLFELKDGEQVLLTTGYEDVDSAPYKLNIATDFDHMSAEMTLAFKEPDAEMRAMENYTIEMAEGYRKEMAKFFI